MTHCVNEQDILSAIPSNAGTGGISSESGGSSGASTLGGTSSGGTSNGGMQGGQTTAGGQDSLGGQASTGGLGQGGDGAWTDCFQALALGKDGDSCMGPFSCSTRARPPTVCCHAQASCGQEGKLSLLSDICDDCTCTTDANCPSQFWCTDGRCRRCVQPPPGAFCARGLVPYPRNGCTWCVLPNECGSGPPGVPPPTCSSNQQCYAGRTCLAGCHDDPTCCFGNICKKPGCGSTQELDCSIVGCPDGLTCTPATFGQECECSQGRWNCGSPQKNTCAAQ